jgi:3-(3-hydroxy-phenyl)propionate hydroxylase
MSKLITDMNLADGDATYAALVKMTEGMNETEAQKTMAKLVLLLANHIGDDAVLNEAMAIARGQPATA